MKILEIVLSLSSGGAERFVVDLCNEMSKTEDVTLLSLKKLDDDTNGFYLHEISNRIKVKSLDFEDGFHISYPLKVWRRVHKENPDVVHIHGACDKYCTMVMALHKKHTKVFQTIHNDIERSYSHGYHKFQINILGRLGLMKFITISQTNHNDFQRLYPNIGGTMIYNGRSSMNKTELIDSVCSEIENLKPNSDTMVLLHVARCAEQKNQQLLMEAFNRWIAEGTNAILLVIGADFDKERGIKLQQMSCKNIKYLGTRSNIADYMLCSDAFILSSKYEGMPITVIEALMCGLPILSTPTCGVVDVVRNMENGLISPDHKVDSFLAMLRQYGQKKEKLKQITMEDVDKLPFHIQKCSSEYIKYFKSKGF